MARDIDASTLTELAKGHFTAAILVSLELTDSTERFTNAGQNLLWDEDLGGGDFTFYGVGNMGSINAVEEGSELKGYSIELTASGVPSDMITDAFSANYQNQPCKIWLSVMNSNHVIVGSPILLFNGRMDNMNIVMGGKTASVTVSAHSRLIDWARIRGGRWNHRDQQIVDPTDLGLQYIASLADKDFTWGPHVIFYGDRNSTGNIEYNRPSITP